MLPVRENIQSLLCCSCAKVLWIWQKIPSKDFASFQSNQIRDSKLKFLFQLAVQFSIWDRIKDLQANSKHQLTNLGQFVLYLVTNSSLAISVLKVVEFGELDKANLRLVRQILLGILLGKEEVCKEVKPPVFSHFLFCLSVICMRGFHIEFFWILFR